MSTGGAAGGKSEISLSSTVIIDGTSTFGRPSRRTGRINNGVFTRSDNKRRNKITEIFQKNNQLVNEGTGFGMTESSLPIEFENSAFSAYQ